MRKTFSLITASLFVLLCYAQSADESIGVSYNFWGLKINEGSQQIKLSSAVEKMAGHPAAYEMMSNARRKYRNSRWLLVPGSVGLGYYVVSEGISSGERTGRRVQVNLVPAIALGLTAAGIGMELGAVRKMKQAADLYNKSLGNLDGPLLDVGFMSDGVGLRLRF